MIKILFICHGRIRTFVWSGLKSRLLENENGICAPIVPLFCASVPRQPKSKTFGLEFVNRTVLDKNEYDLWWKEFLRGLLFVCIKCRFECRLSVGLFIWNCCICSREMEVDKYEHYDAPKCYQNVPNCY